MQASLSNTIQYDDFLKVDIRSGTILDATLNPKANKPAYILTIDFGDLGIKTSSAQITENYQAAELIGRQIVAVTNFPSKRIAGIASEVLVLACISPINGTVLLQPTQPVPAGSRVL